VEQQLERLDERASAKIIDPACWLALDLPLADRRELTSRFRQACSSRRS
jgi:hypothetical protein